MEGDKIAWLIHCANDLAERYYNNGSVSIRRILKELQVPLVKRVDENIRKEYGEIALIPPNSYKIVLVRKTDQKNKLSGSERFTLAHELAHLLLIRRFQWNPRTGSEYYKLEESCDAFAGRLLAPAFVISQLKWTDPYDLLQTLARLRGELKISWEVIAQEFAAHHKNLTLCLGFRGSSRFKKRFKKEAVRIEWSYGSAAVPLFRDSVRKYYISSDRTVGWEILSNWAQLRRLESNIIQVKGLLIAGRPISNDGIVLGIARSN